MPIRHEVQQGECLTSIATQYRMKWETIWDFGDNADLKSRRKDPNVLFPGDIIVVPDIKAKVETRATGLKHTFKVATTPTHIKIRLTINDKPRAGLAYELLIDGEKLKGSTDGDGYLKADVPADARSGQLVVGDKDPKETYELAFGTLDPLDTTDGVEERLRSLGLNTEGDLTGAIQSFQTKHKLEPTGTVDDALRNKLKEIFGQ